MSLHSWWRSTKRNTVRRPGSPRPELQILEDRLPPGQMWLGGSLGGSLLGASFTALQSDTEGTDAQATLVDLQSAASNTGALALTQAGAVPVQDALAFASPSQVQVTLSTPITGTDGGTLSSGTTGLSQDGDLTGLMGGAQHKLPSMPHAPLATNQATGDAGAVNLPPGGSGVLNGPNGTMPPLDNAAMTAPVPSGWGGSHKGVGTPSNGSHPPGTVIGINYTTNDPAACSNGNGVIKSETAITQSGNTVVVGYNDFRGFYCPQNGFQVNGWSYSTDRGITWTDGHALPNSGQWRGDPWLATGPDGTIYMTGLYGNPSLTSIGVLRGTVDPNTGLVSWSSPTIVNLGSPDKEAIAVDPNSGTIYITYTSFSGNQAIRMIQSTDGGVTFSSPVTVVTGSVQGSQVAVGPNGEVYVTWDIGYPSDSGLGFAYSLDGGQTFTVETQIERTQIFAISGTDRAPAFPHMAVDLSGGPYTGNIYITWQSAHLSGKGDALMTSSNDGGLTWNPPITINDNGTTGIDWFPTVTVDSNGFVHSFFYDRRDNPGTTLTNLYYARSTDGGQSFEPNYRVTDVTSNFQTQSDGTPSWGDYINSYSNGPSVSAAWADGRLGHPNTDFVRVGSRP
jgi:hypothetical protein